MNWKSETIGTAGTEWNVWNTGENMERFELSQELGREILDTAKAKGASQGDVVMAESDSFFVTVRMGEVEKISQAGEKRLGLRLFFGNSSASASTSDISRKSIEKLVDDTARMARVTAQDPHGGLPEAADLARELPHLDLLDEPARAVSVDEKIQIALDTEKSALAFDARITNSEGAEFSNQFGRVIYVSSHGFAGEYSGSTFRTLGLARWRNITARCSATIGIRPIANSPSWNRPKGRRKGRATGVAPARRAESQNLRSADRLRSRMAASLIRNLASAIIRLCACTKAPLS